MFNNELGNSDIAIVDAYYWLGKLYTELGNYSKAKENYEYILENYKEYTLTNEIKESLIELEQVDSRE